jgi:hypothetical protein
MLQINYWYEELQKAVNHYEKLINQLDERSEGTTNLNSTDAICERAHTRILELKKSFGLELKLVKDKTIKANYEMKAKVLDSEVANLRQRQHRNASHTTGKANDDRGNDDLLEDTHQIQDLTFESLGRSRGLIEESRTIGMETLATLKDQHEQMEDVENEIDVMDSNLQRAEKLILNFSRRMATDRIIQLFAFVNIVILFSLILYVAISGRSLTASNNSNNGVTGPVFGGVPSFRPSLAPTE